MLRISRIQESRSAATLPLEGQLVCPWSEELEKVCAPLLKEGCAVTLDFAEVTFIDRPELARLSSLAARGVKLTRLSPFLEEQLRLVTQTRSHTAA